MKWNILQLDCFQIPSKSLGLFGKVVFCIYLPSPRTCIIIPGYNRFFSKKNLKFCVLLKSKILQTLLLRFLNKWKMSHLKTSIVKMSHHSLKKRILQKMCTLMSPRFLMNVQGEHRLFSYIIFKFLIRFRLVNLFILCYKTEVGRTCLGGQ